MGIMKSIKKYRLEAKAEIKAAQKRAAASVKAGAKREERQQRLLAKAEKGLIKQENKGLKAKRKQDLRLAKAELAKIKARQFNSDNVKRFAGAARVLAPLLIPVVYRGVTMCKERRTAAAARRLGVTEEQLSQFAGYGAPLKARIQGVRNSLKGSPVAVGFKADARDRLDELDAAVDNAEHMTAEQRRRAHGAIEKDLDQLTGQIEERLKEA